MEQTYLECQHGSTQQCPEIANPIMTNILALLENKDITVETIEEVDGLCRNCGSFEVRK